MRCPTFWGTHGCELRDGHRGPHRCDCCPCGGQLLHLLRRKRLGCVGRWPYYRGIYPPERAREMAPQKLDW